MLIRNLLVRIPREVSRAGTARAYVRSRCTPIFRAGAIVLAVLASPVDYGQSASDDVQENGAFSPRIRLSLVAADGDIRQSRVQVAGLSKAELDALAGSEWSREKWSRLLAVSVAQYRGKGIPAMLGDYQVEDQCLWFTPRYPFRRGLSYQAMLDVGQLPGSGRESSRVISQPFSLPKLTPSPPTQVVTVYPSGETVPENLLKFYLHFSAPMSRGEAYQRIHLLEASGKKIEFPFLELGQELWDNSGTRFTLFFDPGRIKRGLKPREEFGPVLEEGKTYTLLVDRHWRDAEGRPLSNEFRKPLKVVAPDDTQPAAARWSVVPPTAGTRVPLKIVFREPLDHAMLQRVLVVVDAAGGPVAGKIDVDQQETRWSFRPTDPWKAGSYSLLVDTALEDRAGNSIGRRFEVDILRPIQQQVTTDSISLSFDVRSPSPGR